MRNERCNPSSKSILVLASESEEVTVATAVFNRYTAVLGDDNGSVVRVVRVVVSDFLLLLVSPVFNSELLTGGSALHTLVWWCRLQWRQRYFDLHSEILCFLNS